MENITIIETEERDLTNSMLIVAFPTVGLISSIAGHHILQTLEMHEIGGIISNKFMPTTVIRKGHPSPPVRIYSGEKICGPDDTCDQITMIISEFMPQFEIINSLVDSILTWSKEKKIKVIACLEGTRKKQEESEEIEEKDTETSEKVYGVASSDSMKKTMKKYNIDLIDEGMITGVSGVLLYTAYLQKQDVFCLLSEAHSSYPDSRAAANIIHKLDVMLPGIKIDPKPLLKEAEEIEQKIKSFMEQSKPSPPPQSSIPLGMYR